MLTALHPAFPVAVPTVAAERMLASLYVLVGGALLYAVMFDQDTVISLFVGTAAAQQYHLHEFFHDGRHLAGVPCH